MSPYLTLSEAVLPRTGQLKQRRKMAALTGLSIDSLTLVTDYLRADELVRIYLAGSPPLCHALSRSVRRFSFEWICPLRQLLGDVLRSAPALFPQMTSLSIRSQCQTKEIDHIKAIFRHERLRTLQPGLSSLYLDFPGSQQLFMKDFDGQLLVEAFPRLQSLTVCEYGRLHSSTAVSTPQWISHLPPSLTSLKIANQANYSIYSSCLKDLPPHLTSLDLSGSFLQLESFDLTHLLALETLTIHPQANTFPRWDAFPTGLRTLHLLANAAIKAPHSWRDCFPQLTHLRVLHLETLQDASIKQIADFPPTLRELVFPITTSTPSHAILELISKYSSIIYGLDPYRVPLDLLPRLLGLKTAGLAPIGQTVLTASSFPLGLTSLTAYEIDSSFLKLLPVGLLNLSCALKDTKPASYTFPPTLTRLAFRQNLCSQNLPLRFDLMPVSLISLSFHGVNFVDANSTGGTFHHVGTFQHLTRLTSLRLGSVSTKPRIKFPFEDGNALPPSLTSLSCCAISPTETFWTSFQHRCPYMDNIELTLIDHDLSTLLHLPTSLKSFTASFDAQHWAPRYIRSLPPSLTTLDLKCAIPMKEEHVFAFRDLPRTLRTLYLIISGSISVNLDLASHLPLSITDLQCGRPDVHAKYHDRKKEYFEQKRRKRQLSSNP